MNISSGTIVTAGVLSLFLLIFGGMYGCPKYKVYSQQLEGEAELARATSNRLIAVQEAEAKKEAASKLAEAEVIRAGGVASANKIIGDSLKNNESYLRYLWINNLGEHQNKEVIYIPTETNLPILEATRISKKDTASAVTTPSKGN